MKRIAVFGNYGVGNVGDELMLHIILERIRKQGHEPVVFCGVPHHVHSDHAVETHSFFPVGFRSWFRYFFSFQYRSQLKRATKALKSCSVVIFGGGGLFVDQHIRAVFLWRKQLRLALSSAQKVILLSQNVSLQKMYARWLCLPLLRRVHILSVRDSLSQEFLSHEGISSYLLPDITFLSPPVRHLSEVSKKPLVAIALRSTGVNALKMKILKRFILELNTSFDVHFLAFQTSVFDDRELYRQLDLSFPVSSGEQIFSVLEKSSFVIGMRYHALVFAVQAQIPFLALSYQPKVRAFAEDLQMGDFVVDLADIRFSDLQKRFFALQKGQRELQKHLHEQMNLLKGLSQEYSDFFRML